MAVKCPCGGRIEWKEGKKRSAGHMCCHRGRDHGHVRKGRWTSPFVSIGRGWNVQVRAMRVRLRMEEGCIWVGEGEEVGWGVRPCCAAAARA
jgi:hypothetical protein